ncbi:MAG: tetratricopeptide repeat protein [Methylococcales bacterium]|nr:tetratricopeptide repeat protein [Methylococcales bacterium]
MKNKESSLFSGWSLILFSLIILVLLLVLFPGKKLLDSFSQSPTDGASVQYLKELIANDSENEQLRMQLSQKLTFLGRLIEAEKTLSPLLVNSEFSNESQFLMIKIQLKQYFNQTDSEIKQTKKKQIVRAINALYPLLNDVPTLDILAQWSYSLVEPALAAKVYQKITEIFESNISEDKVNNSFPWILLGINNAYAAADNVEEITKNAEYYAIKHLQALLAANLLEEAFNKATIAVNKFHHSEQILNQGIKIASFVGKSNQSRDWGRAILGKFGINDEKLQKQLALEMAADDPKNSLQWADLILTNNPIEYPSLLTYAIKLASNLGEKKVFRKLSTILLEQSPNDPMILEQLVQYELALNDLSSALQHASQQVALAPENINARKQLIKVAIWNGAPYYSMQQLSWLYQKTGNEVYLKEAIHIGKGLFQYARVSKQYEMLSYNRILTDDELKDLYEALMQAGYGDSGKRQIEQYTKTRPNHKQAWRYLASIEELNGHYTEAFNTLELTEKNFGKTDQLSKKKVEMLIKAENYEGAWQQLSNDSETKQPSDSFFWKFYTQMAWLLGHEKIAEKGYYHLLSQGDIGQGDFIRLLELNNKKNDSQRELELLLIAWNKYKQSHYLLDAIGLSDSLNTPDQTKRLIIRADNHPDLFKDNIRYWILKARAVDREKNHLLSRKYLLNALELDTQSVSTHIALLWYMIEYDSDSSLRAAIKSSLSIGGSDTGLWEAIAAGYLRLGEPVHAISWYGRAVKKKPNDYLLLLGYAETLSQAGEPNKAKKIKEFVVNHVRPNLIANLSYMKPELDEFKRRYSRVVHENFGQHITEKWFEWVQHENNQVKQVVFDEYRITWLLAENRMNAARRYVLKLLHKRIAIPTWQNMAMAVYDNDIDAVDKLLKGPDKLSPTNQVVALRTVGREQEALISARGYMDGSRKENEMQTLRRQAAGLGIRNPNGIVVTGKNNNIGDLDIRKFNSDIAFTHGVNSYWLNYNYNDYFSNNSNLIIQANQKYENHLSVKWRHTGLRNELWLQGNAGLRDDQDLFGIKAGVRYKIMDGWSANIVAAYNELSEESAAFRLMGARDSISLGFKGQLTKRDYFSFTVHSRNYKTRFGEQLGTGFGADISAGYRIKFAQPEIEINIHGTISESDLEMKLPKEMQAVIGSEGSINDVLSDSYKELGLNLKISDGDFRPLGYVEKSFHYYLNTGVFFTAPWMGTGILVEAGVGTRLFGHDDLTLIGRYVDSQGGVNTTATESIELRYSFRFDEIFPKLLF